MDFFYHFLRDTAAAIPPARSPTAVAAMPIPIKPSDYSNMSAAVTIEMQVIGLNGVFLPLAVLSSITFFSVRPCLQSGAI